MSTSFIDKFSLCSAMAMGLAVSTGRPVGIVAAAGMPMVCLLVRTRKAAFRSTLAYYVAALWPIVPGSARFIGQPAPVLIPLAIWVFMAILLSVPWTAAWASDHGLSCLWRVPLALLATVVPPLGIIGLASPLTAAGYLFPGTGWAGLAAVALLPGILLSTWALGLRRRRLVQCFAIGSCLCLAIGGRIVSSGETARTPGWIAVNTHFGDVSQPFRDYVAAQFIQRKAAETSAQVVIFPESVVPRWSEATEAFWRQSLEDCRRRGQTLLIGAGLPAKPAIEIDDREKLSDLKSYDFAAGIDALNNIDTPSSRALGRPNPEPIDNTLLILGAGSATFYQRVPVPLGMWQPFRADSVPLRLGAPGVLTIDHQRAAVLICYEQLLTFPILASMWQHPTVLVGISNTFWVECTTIPSYQATALRGWAKLFRLPYLSAVNS